MKKINKKIIAILVLSLMVSLSGQTVLAAGPATVNLGSSADFVILAKTAITTTGVTAVIGDIGISPNAASSITGFGLIMDSTNTFATSSLITGNAYATDYTAPTPTKMSAAVSDMEAAYTEASGRTDSVINEEGAGNIGGLTLAPGLYKWGTSVTIPSDVILSGSATDIWIFQVAQNLDIASAKKVILTGGAKSENIFWQVAGTVTLGTYSSFSGNILSLTQINIRTGAVLHGRALAQSQVTLQSNKISNPGVAAPETPIVPEEPVIIHHSSGSSVMPIVINNNSNVSTNTTNNIPQPNIINTQNNEEGCSNGNKFNTANGNICINNIETKIEGCIEGGRFSTTNGQACNNINLSNKYNLGENLIRLGSRGQEVKELQKFLNKKLNMGLDVDGIFGLKTTAVVKKFQKDQSLVSDGYVGVQTKNKINMMAL